MNTFPATITAIESVDNLCIVSFETQGTTLRMMALGLNVSIAIGSKVLLGIKATNIALATANSEMLSISNQLETTIVSVNNGSLLSSIKVAFQSHDLECITTKDASQKLNLHEGQCVTAMIKASDLSILELIKSS